MNSIRCTVSVISISLIALFFCVGCSVAEVPRIKVGLGEAIITPQMDNVPMRGYAARNSTGVHDDLYARSLVIEGEDGTSVVLMTIALCNMQNKYYDQIRSGIQEKTNIPVENIIISATHTHSGPYVNKTSEEYQSFLVERSVASAVDAWNSRVPGRIGFGSTRVLGLGMNDRRMLHGGYIRIPRPVSSRSRMHRENSWVWPLISAATHRLWISTAFCSPRTGRIFRSRA